MWDKVGQVWSNTSQGARDGLGTGWDWVVEHKSGIGNTIGAVAGLAAFGVCVVASLGVCSIAGFSALAVGFGNNTLAQGMPWQDAAKALVVGTVMTVVTAGAGVGLQIASKTAPLSKVERLLTNANRGIPTLTCTVAMKC